MRDINAFDPLPMTLGAKVEAPKEQPVSPLVAFEKGDHTPYHCGGVLTVVGYAVGKHFAPSFGSSNGCIDGAIHGPDLLLPVPVVYEYESMPYCNVFVALPADTQPLLTVTRECLEYTSPAVIANVIQQFAPIPIETAEAIGWWAPTNLAD